jgi:hypothetical protein
MRAKASAFLRALVRPAVPSALRRRIHPARPPWVQAVESPPHAQTLDSVGFYAIVGTWMEADIIADCVANAFAQGVDRVFLFDNCSPDDTINRAVSAGAEHVMMYRTERFEERYRYNLMNEAVRHISESSEHDNIWWLWLDADEFPRPQGEGTLRELLTRTDRMYRTIGARVVNHYPTPGQPSYIPGEHPARFQVLCEEVPDGICELNHRKHPLQRWDRSGPRIDAGPGFHRAECIERPLFEPLESIIIHHVPFREEQTTRRRMEALWSGGASSSSRAIQGDIATDHMEARLHSLDAVYSGDWSNVRNFLPGRPERGVALIPWQELTPPISPHLPSFVKVDSEIAREGDD